MKFILGTKDRMTQVFDEKGVCYPVTILRISPLTVTAVKAADKDGYDAVQVAGGEQKEFRMGKADLGHQGGAKRYVKEFRARASQGEKIEGVEVGNTIDAGVFAPGDTVTISALSKGKGFQGVVKRHGFHGDMASHGRKHSLRMPGSIGGGGRDGGRVIKGMRMGGRMGSDRITVKNLKIVQVNKDENIILVKGAIPGRKGTLVEVRAAA
jgi:large subunit ribosomal protein L3